MSLIVDKDAGWEIDARLKYQIAKNLTYQIDEGYLKPGKFYGNVLPLDDKKVLLCSGMLSS